MITHYLFESIVLPATLAGLGFIVLLFIGQRMEPRRRGRLWVGWMILVVGLFLLQKFVTTGREEVRAALDSLARAVADKNIDQFATLIAPDFSSEGMDRQKLVEFARPRITQVGVDMPTITRCDISIDGDTAVMELTARNIVSFQGFTVPWKSEWTLHWKRGPEGWQVAAIRIRHWGGNPARSLDDLRP